jgi:glycosyltransferase involved in cell wall biosynthesis
VSQPSVTVVVPSFNRADLIGECLDSLLGQTLPAIQILVVDDGSTDETPAVLARYGAPIEVLRIPHGGKPHALNAALPHVRGEYLWIFDDDDVALPDALARLVAPLEAHPEHGFSYSTYAHTPSAPDGRIGEPGAASWLPKVETAGFLPPLLEGNFLGGAGLFARTRCYEIVGPFDTELTRSQDYEMAIRMARAFTAIRVEGPPTFLYRRHDGLRGSMRDRFPAQHQGAKWLAYDQRIFRKLHRDLPLEAHLPPGLELERSRRRALIHRMLVSAGKLLIPEAIADLEAIAAHGDPAPLTPDEKGLLVNLVHIEPFYGTGSIADEPAFFAALGRLSRTSPVVRAMRREIGRALVTRLRSGGRWRSPRALFGAARMLAHSYAG